MDVGNLRASLNLDISQFTKALRDSVKGASAAARDISNAFSGVAVKGIRNASSALDDLAYTAKGTGKDVARITQGIVFSQAFYKALHTVQDTIKGVFDLSKEAELASRSFAVMLKNQEQAVALTEYIKQFAASTNFTFKTASDSVKELLAYGFKLSEVDLLLKTIGDSAAAMGDPQAFDRIARALGQIRTKGKLATQEMLQLTEAGIPAFEILQEKLGLTRDQLSKLGKTGIDATTAINALLAGMQERYGGSMKLMADTVDGYMNNIKETFNAMASEMFSPLYRSLKNMLRNVSNAMSEMYDIVKHAGVGGLIDHMFSAETAAVIRQLVGAIQIFNASLWNLLKAIAPFIREIIKIGAAIGGIVLPVLSLFMNMLSALLQLVYSNTKLMNAFRVAIAGLLILKTIIFLIKGLATVITALTSPIFLVVAGVTALVAVFATLAGQGSKVVGIVNSIGKAISNLYGITPSDILPPEIKDPPKLEDITDMSNKIEDLGDAAEDAGKKAKKAGNNLMAFDEVFTLTEKHKEPDKFEAPDFEMPSLGDLNSPLAGLGEGFDTSGIKGSAADITGAVDGMVEKLKGMLSSLTGGIGPKIKDALSGIFSARSMDMSLFDAIKNLGKTMFDTFTNVIFPIAVDFNSRFIQPVADAFVTHLLPTLIDMLNGVIQIVTNIVSNLGKIAESLYNAFKPVIDFITTVVTGVMEAIDIAWSNHGQDLVNSINGIIDSICRIFRRLIDDIIAPIIEPFMEMLTRVWNEHLKDLVVQVLEFVMKLVGYAEEIQTKFIEPLCNFLIDLLAPHFISAFKMITDVVEGFLIFATETVSSILTVLEGLIEFLLGVFTGDWDRAFGGIQKILEGFNNFIIGLGDGLKKILFGVIDWLNRECLVDISEFCETLKRIIGIAIDRIIEAFQGVLKFLEGLAEFLIGAFTGDWDKCMEGLKKMVEGLAQFIGNIVAGIIEIFGTLVEYLGGKLVGAFDWAIEHTSGVLQDLLVGAKGVVEGLLTAFGGIVDFIAGIFTGDWERAWNGVVKIFEGIFKGIVSIAKTPLNMLISMVNGVIKGLNTLPRVLNNIPGINLPTIPELPKLKKGGLVTKHTLAEIGEENKKEAVIPLENGTAIDTIAGRILQGIQSNLPKNDDHNPKPQQERPILYVGTLIADDRSLRELERRMEVVRMQEADRRGK